MKQFIAVLLINVLFRLLKNILKLLQKLKVLTNWHFSGYRFGGSENTIVKFSLEFNIKNFDKMREAMTTKKKSKLDKMEDNDLRLGYTNLLLFQEKNNTKEVQEMIAEIKQEVADRGKDFIIGISEEEFRCGWVQRRKTTSDELEAVMIEAIPNWKE